MKDNYSDNPTFREDRFSDHNDFLAAKCFKSIVCFGKHFQGFVPKSNVDVIVTVKAKSLPSFIKLLLQRNKIVNQLKDLISVNELDYVIPQG